MCKLGKRIRSRRIELGYSAEELAPMVGLSPATIYRYENGDIKKVSTNKIKPFAVALKTSEAYLMGWTDDPSEAVADKGIAAANAFAESTAFSPGALRVARAYDSMSEYGKKIIDLVVDNEGKYKVVKAVPMLEIKVAHDSDLYARYNAKKEVDELEAEEKQSNSDKI